VCCLAAALSVVELDADDGLRAERGGGVVVTHLLVDVDDTHDLGGSIEVCRLKDQHPICLATKDGGRRHRLVVRSDGGVAAIVLRKTGASRAPSGEERVSTEVKRSASGHKRVVADMERVATGHDRAVSVVERSASDLERSAPDLSR
jgi:hypothetical protein